MRWDEFDRRRFGSIGCGGVNIYLNKLYLMLLCETNRLLIRTMEKDDLVDFHEYRSNPEVVKYQ
jgi:hypothetical protein